MPPSVPKTLTTGSLHQLHQTFARLHVFEDVRKIPFELISTDGLPIAGTPLGRAEIIRMFLACLAPRPTGAQGVAAIVAEDKASQG